jgi:hypothetical protein
MCSIFYCAALDGSVTAYAEAESSASSSSSASIASPYRLLWQRSVGSPVFASLVLFVAARGSDVWSCDVLVVCGVEGVVHGLEALTGARVRLPSLPPSLPPPPSSTCACSHVRHPQVWLTDVGAGPDRSLSTKSPFPLFASPVLLGSLYVVEPPLLSYMCIFCSLTTHFFVSVHCAARRVFAASHSGHLYALSAHTGRRQWAVYVGDTLHASPFVVSHASRVFVTIVGKNGVVSVIELDSHSHPLRVWRQPLPGLDATGPGVSAEAFASPVLHSAGSDLWLLLPSRDDHIRCFLLTLEETEATPFVAEQ